MLTRGVLVALSMVFAAPGCASDAQKPESRQLFSTCVRLHEKERRCTDEFIPALVASRVKLGKPAKIVELDQKMGRAALIDTAKQEWKNDSSDEGIRKTCDTVVEDAAVKKYEDFEALADLCLVHAGCKEFVTCIMPLLEQTL